MPPSSTFVVLAALGLAACAPRAAVAPPAPLVADAPERAPLRWAIHASADYLARACGTDGRFVYRVDLDSGRPLGGYNVLRHAGAMYALASYQARWPRASIGEALARAADHLAAYLSPTERPDVLAVWSDPAERGEAKLGGAGLALVALGAFDRLAPDPARPALLGSIGRFVLSMQKASGGFHSKYLAGRGPDDRFVSLYYPGEAALGLVMLSEIDGEDRWRSSALRALLHLAEQRRGRSDVPADHWALLATERLLRQPVKPRTRNTLLRHALQIGESMLAARVEHPPRSPLSGCFGDDGRTTPTATRLEGLLALHALLPPEHPLRAPIRRVAREGVAFLLRAQHQQGVHRGAMPRSVDPEEDQAREARIDYAQHALSAWIQYLELSEAEGA